MEVWSPLRDNSIIWHFSAHECLYIKMRKALAWSRCISDEMPAALWEGHFLLEDKKSGLERRTKRRCRNWVTKVLLERASSYELPLFTWIWIPSPGSALVTSTSHFWAGQQWFVGVNGLFWSQEISSQGSVPLSWKHPWVPPKMRHWLWETFLPPYSW